MRTCLLIVDDDPATAEDLRRFLAPEFECLVAGSAAEAMALAGRHEVAAALVDLDLGSGPGGFEVIAELRRVDPRTAILIVSGDDTDESLRRAGELGVEDYLRKSSGDAALKRAIQQALVLRRVKHRAQRLEEEQDGSEPRLVAESPGMKEALNEALRAARHNLPVLIVGPVGAGKLAVARVIHQQKRRGRPFEVIHCGTLDTSVVDSQLFGHEPGAFTDARTRFLGAFERAEDGTLVLDDIDCLPRDKQVRLLQPLEQRVLRRLGGGTEIPVRCRILATSNKDLDALVSSGAFLPDLLSRLQGAPPIRVPGVRDRLADLPALAQLFAEEAARENGWIPRELPQVLMQAVLTRPWRDTRQLRNAIAYVVAMSQGREADPALLPDCAPAAAPSPAQALPVDPSLLTAALLAASGRGSLRQLLDRVRLDAVRAALADAQGDKRAAAARLGITTQWLNSILRETEENAP